MSQDTQTLKFTHSVKAGPEQVYYAFTHASALNQWLCNFSTVIPNVGGRIYLWWNSGYFSSGEFIQMEKNKRLSFTWHGRHEPDDTLVSAQFVGEDGHTLVELDHSGFGTGEAWGKIIKECQDGWEKGLENLSSIFDTGEDLRYVRRPMLGILINEFDEDIAKKMGVPVKKGIRIDKPVENLGAEAAGLLSDDVIVSLGGNDTTDYPELATALQGHHAGDKVEVIFYRGSEKKSTMMKLSSRPFPEIPQNTKEFARALEARYSTQRDQLQTLLVNLTEEEAAYKPALAEWSIKETLAHLVQSEQGWNTWISGVISGYQPHYDDYGGNLPVFTQATLTAYPTIAELLEQFNRCNKETVALVEDLPNDLPTYKNMYWFLSINMLEPPYHFNGHLEQMESTLKAARK
jgi:uncharacterized protein YndB with AHSA1/START domain/uncharacterized damage-inducible protein DinB